MYKDIVITIILAINVSSLINIIENAKRKEYKLVFMNLLSLIVGYILEIGLIIN